MLEIKNLTKIYKSKKAEDVKALDNVSLTFNNTGLVFLLGKSGSGKSTLLNVLGGLDKFDSGEIIIDGRSSKNFKEKDFDSYRNTYLGFIFQEYNILQEFTVYKNIEFALELQGKKADKEAINNLLEQVDLKGYGKRKPNELSGGQKQRIAIARALIKNPQIIMADEPTGALDSNTGKQVFDTLKKLSEEKLVIVVSHDREFAEFYADRIIELKDGKVISDTTKRKKEPTKLNEGFNLIDSKVIHIEKGHKYTKEEIEKLNEFLKTAEGDIILTSDEKLNKDVKKLAKIDDIGNREFFDETKSEDIDKQSKEKLSLIKSRFKFKDSFKMGASGLKTKKVRLFFTILLSAVALTLFGLADTMASYNVKKSNYESLMKLNVDTISINNREVGYYEDGDKYYNEGNAGKADLMYLQEHYPDYYFKEIYSTNMYISGEYLTAKGISNTNYYTTNISGLASLTTEEMQKLGLSFYAGSNSRLPETEDEVVITDYHFDILKEYGLKYYEEGENESSKTLEQVNSVSDVIGKRVKINYNTEPMKIVGILDTKLDLSKYEKLKRISYENMTINDFSTLSEMQTIVQSGFHTSVILSQQNINNIIQEKGVINTDRIYFSVKNIDEPSSNYTISYASKEGDDLIERTKTSSTESVMFFDSSKTTLAADEVLIGQNVYINVSSYSKPLQIRYTSSHWFEDIGEYGDYAEAYYIGDNYDEYVYYKTKEEAFAAMRQEFMNEFYNDYGYTLPLATYTYGDAKKSNLKVVGVYYNFDDSYSSSEKTRAVYFKNEQSVPKECQNIFNQYSSIVTKLTGDKSKDHDLIMFLSDYNSDETCLVIRSEVSSMLENFVEMINMLAKVFLYIGIGFAVFSALLLMNFIGVSISYKKKEIGILRALGAKGTDVYGIFLNESLIITFINSVVSIILTFVGCILINNLVTSGLGISITLLSFGIRQVLLILAVSLLVALVASFLPTHKVSKMKPIDAILDRKTK